MIFNYMYMLLRKFKEKQVVHPSLSVCEIVSMGKVWSGIGYIDQSNLLKRI